MTKTIARPPLGLALKRALRLRCPHCGEGKLFASYLKQVKTCPHCDEAFGHIRSDDAAPWLTMLVVGHLYVPTLISVEAAHDVPPMLSAIMWPVIGIGLCLAALPFAKAIFIAAIWTTGAPGSER